MSATSESDILKSVRHHLHTYPERSGLEVKTKAFLYNLIAELNPDRLDSVADTGIIAVWRGEEQGPTTLVRADIDALPLAEASDNSPKSSFSDVAHLCGHDGHATSLYGLGRLLAENPIHSGQVVLLWQPSEENGRGAPSVLEDENFQDILPDRTIAYHNIPGRPLGEIIYRKGTFSSAVISCSIELHGKSSHAAEPQNAHSAIPVISELLQWAKEINNQEKPGVVVTPICIQSGSKAYGTTPGDGEIHFTLRSYTNEELTDLQEQLKRTLNKTCQSEGLKHSIVWLEHFPATENDSTLVSELESYALKKAGPYWNKEQPFAWGEDFGHFSQHYPSLYFGLGSGIENTPLHTPSFQYPDELLPIARDTFFELLQVHYP